MSYIVIFVLLLVAELVYFKIADRCNIIDKPNERSSHSTIVLRGGGIIFLIGVWIWSLAPISFPEGAECSVPLITGYWPFLLGLTLVAGVSFIDDIHSLPDSVRLVTQFLAMGLMFYQLGMFTAEWWWMIIPALIVCVGASNIINFMDGINGITGAYALATLVPAYLVTSSKLVLKGELSSFIMVSILSVLVFCIFNFREKGKAKCFAGDVGSLGAAFIMLFVIGSIIMQTLDVTWLIFLVLYGLDGVTTICHRIMLHENLGEAHRKHTYQLMANELGMSHLTVSLIFAVLQLAINLGFVYLVPNTMSAHWIYLVTVILVFGFANLAFRKKYYHLHAEYLESLKK